ncbi:DUF1150 family protein [Nitratireductor kimnyeongensis]|uniref:DUF1150 family protein n=1 Tax=Nitratireductor kimnyeongensis TaxID=430679 RepID=A0ABW0T786_9HYPH|nr:DUF1150 family protein [Nitratireductor kimnyeongensis]QZZ34242.1 DUF1150 family protein [Nitratireductor kimnyeongensis]
MTEHELKLAITQQQLAHIGEGAVAYMREMNAEDLQGKFPGMPDLTPGTRLWALFGADGQPILLADARDAALAGAMQNDLETVSVH